MGKTAVISARIDSALKRNAEDILEKLGLTRDQAITIFYKQVELERGLPFKIGIPNKDTQRALEDARKRRRLGTFNTLDDLFKDLSQ
jgi:DNA-damage-inducible protein J